MRVYKAHGFIERIARQPSIFIETDSRNFKPSTSKGVRHVTKHFFRATFGVDNTPNINQNNM